MSPPAATPGEACWGDLQRGQPGKSARDRTLIFGQKRKEFLGTKLLEPGGLYQT